MRNLPDESCRKCGGLLLNYSLCGKCKSATRFICRICGTITLEQFHELFCFRVVEYNEKITVYPLRHDFTIIGTICLVCTSVISLVILQLQTLVSN